MALVLKDRVVETTDVAGTGSASLLGAQDGYQAFSVIGNGNTTYYTIYDPVAFDWEVGIGTYASSGNVLARTTVLSSSNSGSLVAFGSGTKDIFLDLPSEKVVALGALTYQGTWNATTNVPTLASSTGTQGYYYVVSVAGSTNLNGITDWQVGDWAIYNGTAWQKIDNTDAVSSVNGQTGTVVLTYSDVGAQVAGTYVTSVSGTAPVASSGGTTPAISMAKATGSVDGYLSSTDWTTFNSKGTGNVVGPSSATDNAITRYDTTTGKLIQNSTVTIDDNGNIDQANAITFDITPATLPTTPGSLYWDNADGNQTLSLVMEGNHATQQIGEEIYYRIKASSAITEGQVIMFTGTVGASGGLKGAPATGLTSATASYVMGVATQNIPLNDWGYITQFGLVRQINTTGGAESWVDGQILYLDPTVAGGLTKTLPTAPNPKVQVCAVVYAASNGSLFIRPTFGGEFGQYEGDVGFTSVAAGNLIRRNASNTAWENVTTIPNTNLANSSITINGSAVSLGGSVSVGTVTSVTGTSPIASSGGATPAISISQATTSTNGYLSSTDWNTFNNKGSGTVTSVTGTAPVVSSGGATPAISMAAATTSVSGYLTSTDWTTFNNKTSNTGTVTSVGQTFTGGLISVAGSPVTTSGTLALTVAGTSGGIPYFSSATGWASSAALTASALIIGGGAGVAPSSITTGTGVITALGVNTGAAGSFVVYNNGLGTPSSGNLSSCTADGTDQVGFKNIPQNSQSAAYTLVLADAGKHIYHPASDANVRTFTIPAASSVAYPIGTAITFVNLSASVVTIAITTDTMYLSSAGTTGSRSLAQYGTATALKVSGLSSAGIWVISGSGLT